MTSNEVLAMYENIAGITAKMAVAARAGDMDSLGRLEADVASETRAIASGVPALSGDARQRKIELLKQIMANDRAVRDVTEPWQGQLAGIMTH
ncbi:flagellar protein FliT [Massilia sp. TS11]|uniref:flagellar protein FliT n=1 Tax=Massilia sp. TS11 TaxID=2908003 RepID=UPI001EDBE11F|nr:flagellar protein FliT [Massilia sp. TS11]MCG2585641.1 flagellar protein FliT [Massilia sp. TS11]